MRLSLQSGGGSEHVTLVKLASHKIIDEFESLYEIQVRYEPENVKVEFKINEQYGKTILTSGFDLRPDIVAIHSKVTGQDYFGKGMRNTVWNIIEAETKPKTIFRNKLKMLAYEKMKEDHENYYHFILVCWSDAKLPDSIEPFNEVWKFEKSEYMTKEDTD